MKNKTISYYILPVALIIVYLTSMIYFNLFDNFSNWTIIYPSVVILEVALLMPLMRVTGQKNSIIRILNFTGIVLALAFLVVFLITGTKIALGLGLLFSTLIIMDSLIISIFKK
ncbi:hypothetical protein [Companilactobacillus metriopterae]|uniref:hypothetical protein n=1 Tax=Companilactobacillus metriopterae TaxID=1909267 RepID=UPI00100B8AEB|nr:hypothetical protein [Companilactobacillus metriopterae]